MFPSRLGRPRKLKPIRRVIADMTRPYQAMKRTAVARGSPWPGQNRVTCRVYMQITNQFHA